MDKDFHYYGTYVAACVAGYSATEAQTIAHAAQYVDDSVKSRLVNIGDYGIDFQPIPTCQTATEIGWGNFSGSLEQWELRNVWVPFHFLPGNYKSEAHPDPNAKQRMKAYTGPREYKWWGPNWAYGERQEWQFKLMCLAQSPLVTAMINDITNNHKGEPHELHLVGLRMHVHADTGAHMYYSGTPAWHVNDAGSKVYDLTVNPKQEVPFGLTGEWTTPPALSFESYFYLAHGRMGHLPDYGWLIYEYSPKWSAEPVRKNNPAEYIHRFKEMVTAMRCVREGQPFDVLTVDEIDEKIITAVEKILRQPLEFGLSYNASVQRRCNAWQNAIKGGELGSMVVPQEYKEDAWFEAAKQGLAPIDATDYYKFNWAALKHFEFVRNDLENGEGIPMTEF